MKTFGMGEAASLRVRPHPEMRPGAGVFQDWGDERLMGWAGSEPPSAPEDWRLLPPHAGGGPNPDTVMHYVAPVLKRAVVDKGG